AFARAGARVLVCARTARDVEALAASLRDEQLEAHACAADLASEEGADAFATAAFEKLGGVDLGLICVGAAQAAVPVREARRALWRGRAFPGRTRSRRWRCGAPGGSGVG